MDKHERVGELFISAGAALWGLFPILTILSLSALPAMASLAWTLAFAVLFFAFVITARGKWREVANTRALPDIFLTALFVGIIYYILQFTGLQFTSAGNASMLALTETFFSYLLFNVWYKERFPAVHIAGAALMILGAGIVLYPNTTVFNTGDFLIVAAAAIAPFGNFFQRRARTKVSSETVMFVRSIISATFVFSLATLTGAHPFIVPSARTLMFLGINGIFMLGLSKIFWIEGIHRISVTKANALSSLSPLVTLLCASFILHTPPTLFQLTAFIPMFFGVVLLSRKPLEDGVQPA